MSVQAMVWALDEAPDVPMHLVSVLVGLANHADENGRGSYPSQETLARYARKNDRSIRRDLDQLEELGLIARGDQRFVLHLPVDKRPVVWDLSLSRKREPRPARKSGGRPRKARETGGTPTSTGFPGQEENRGDVGVQTGGTPTSNRGDAHVLRTVLEPSLEPSSLKPPPVAPLQGGAVADESTTTSPSGDQSAASEVASPTPRDRAFGIARGWIKYRTDKGLPIVTRGRNGALHALRSLIEPFAGAGYSDDELKRALADIAEGIPSTAQLERALVARRSGPRPARPGGRNSGANRHVDDMTPEQRAARNPFLTAVRSSDHAGGAA